MVCKCFLPFCRLLFHFVNCLFCYAEAFEFDVVHLLNFVCVCFLRDSQKIVGKATIAGFFPYVFFQEFYGNSPYVSS